MLKLFAVAASVLLISGLVPVKAEQVSFGPSLAGAGWKPLNFRGLKPVDYRAEGANRLSIRADGASSVIWRELDETFWPKTQAKWRWKVDQSVPATNLAVKGSDDRAIALYFVFAKDEASARNSKGATSFTSAMWRSSGAALVYVWGGSGTRGQVVASPHLGSSGKLVLRQPGGITNVAFQPEMANLAADFRRAFGRDPGPLVGVAVSSDSDDTKGVNVGIIEALSVD